MVWRLLAISLAFFTIGCSRPVSANRINSSRPSTTAVISVGQPLSVNVDQLLQAPEAYQGRLVRLTGQFRRAPVIVCDGITRRAPATWRLAQTEQFVAAGGYETLIPVLLPPGMTVTVDGVWRFWRGPVGCGKEAPMQSIWYLAVTDVIAPSPIARVTLTPFGAEPQPTADQTEPPSEPPPIGTPAPAPSSTVTAASTTAPATPQATSTTQGSGVATMTSTPTPDENDDEAVDDDGTTTPQATATDDAGAPGTVTVTATAQDTTATATAAATATPGGSVVDKGIVEYQDLRGELMGNDETHSWLFDVEAGDFITVSIIAEADADIVMSVFDPGGNRVLQEDSGGTGQIERIEGLEVQSNGRYRIVISESSSNETYYAMLLLNDNYEDYYPFVFSGLLTYGASASSNMAEATDQFWFFFGNSQEVVNISVSPTDGTDLFIDLFGPDGELLEGTIDSAGNGGDEQMRNYVLPGTGLYGVRVGEVFYEASTFTILVSRN